MLSQIITYILYTNLVKKKEYFLKFNKFYENTGNLMPGSPIRIQDKCLLKIVPDLKHKTACIFIPFVLEWG